MKILLLLIIAVTCIKVAVAQVYLGAKSGVTISKFHGDKWNALEDYTREEFVMNEEYKQGLRVFLPFAIYCKIPLTERTSIQPEIVYTKRGMAFTQSRKLEVNNVFIEHKYSYSADLHYLDLPVFIRHKLVKGLHVATGMQISFLSWATSEKFYDLQFIDPESKEVITSEVFLHELEKGATPFNKLDIAIAGGASYEFEMGLNLGVRAFYGLTNVYKDSFSYKNLSIQAVAGYSIEL